MKVASAVVKDSGGSVSQKVSLEGDFSLLEGLDGGPMLTLPHTTPPPCAALCGGRFTRLPRHPSWEINSGPDIVVRFTNLPHLDLRLVSQSPTKRSFLHIVKAQGVSYSLFQAGQL